MGKTLVAKGVIAEAIDYLWNDIDRIDVIYVCANSNIARQNINRLNIIGEREFSFATRITLLPLEIHDLKQNKLNFISFTPGTSFDLKSRGGRAKERIMIYHMLRKGWNFGSSAGPKNLFQVGVKRRKDWRNRLSNFDKSLIDDELAEAYLEELDKRPRFKEEFKDLIDRFSHYRTNIPYADRKDRNRFIGELRQLLAETCISELEPDLIIMDEFQRFKYLLDGDDDVTELAHILFNQEEVRLLLLSATPYKMYTMYHESEEDNHYQDLIRTVDFLFDSKKETESFKYYLKKYRRELFNIRMNGIERIKEVKDKIEAKLSKVMVRNERIDVSRDQNAMLAEAENETPRLVTEELYSFNLLDEVSDILNVNTPLNYWKSAPYLLNFMDKNYKLKRKLEEASEKSEKSQAVKEAVEESNASFIFWSDIHNYNQLNPENAKLRSIIEENIENGAWKLLWIAPSAPYYKVKEGPYSCQKLTGFTKSIVFSSWRVVPKVISMFCSYEAERRMITEYDDSVDYKDIWDNRVQLLSFSIKEEKPNNMSNLTLIYPSFTLSQTVDPMEIANKLGEGQLPSKQEIFSRVSEKIEQLIKPIITDYRTEGEKRTDERWYWASLALLDREHNYQEANDWFNESSEDNSWYKMITSNKGEKNTGFKEHVDLFKEFLFDSEAKNLGKPPEDLIEILTKIALAAPGTVALRSYNRLLEGKESKLAIKLFTSAAQTAIGFRSLFNLPDSSYLIRSLDNTDNSRYWEAVLDYSLGGNLQSVLDEYIHILRETNGLTNKSAEYKLDQICSEVEKALTIRSATLEFDELETKPELNLVSHRIRCRYALQFGDNKDDEGKKTRAGQVRTAFNSPFKPFILATTSIGKEGLDFHLYSHKIYHWNLPSNPVDLEQREGRIHRYKGHAIRRNVAQEFNISNLNKQWIFNDPWDGLFELAKESRDSEKNDLIPFWIYDLDEGEGFKINRHVPALPLSKELNKLEYLKKTLGAYRMVFGQPRQEDLINYLSSHLEQEFDIDAFEELKINLSPKK